MARARTLRRIPRGRLGLALAIGLIGLVATAAPAGAASVSAVGTVTCSVGSTLTFDPPLQPGIGTPVAKNASELITLAPATIGSCAGSVTKGSIPVSGVSTKSNIFKVKPFDFNRNYFAGGCLFVNALQLRIKSMALDWTAASGVLKPTKFKPGYATLGSDPGGNLGFSFSSTAKGSFAGPAALGLYFTAASTTALQDCESGSGTISTLTIDPTQSSVALG